MTNSAYVYAINIDGHVRYIGKGHGRRAQNHVTYAKQLLKKREAGLVVGATCFYNGLAAAIRDGLPVGITIIASGLSNDEACDLERKQIQAIRASLWNILSGGQGLGPADARAMWQDVDYREKQKIIGQPARLKALWSNPDFVSRHRSRQSALAKSKLQDPDHVKSLRDGLRKKWTDPEFRERKTRHNSEIAKANNARPEKRAQQSLLIKKQSMDPDFAEKRLAGLRAHFARRKEAKLRSEQRMPQRETK